MATGGVYFAPPFFVGCDEATRAANACYRFVQ